MDLSQETSIEKLKAMAYDQIAQSEIIQSNLRALNARIAELSQDKPVEVKEK